MASLNQERSPGHKPVSPGGGHPDQGGVVLFRGHLLAASSRGAAVVGERPWRGRVFIAASLDGFIARPDGAIDWLTDPAPGPRHHAPQAPAGPCSRGGASARALEWEQFLPGVDHLVMGRGTYEKVLGFEEWPYEDLGIIVLSTALEAEDPRITPARSLGEAVALLDARGARQVYVDGGRVIQSFLREDLIDEITLAWAPVLLGSGLPLFGALPRDTRLELVASHTGQNGLVHATYRVYRPG
ncbi:dihydrofolate reductase family protein [Actinomyces bowdenii]|uniref:Dihydrofolate reductase family protein n=1 Tax=Actinomyces bowdenii TaxID=131109 RepID=A0A853EK50_9ACTO|nr:dihydrofolate reductase family protein [Actinomyces bowdenii]NYS69165.1 dihydrofolate reductase family protein [Actinomyces bowdenii]